MKNQPNLTCSKCGAPQVFRVAYCSYCNHPQVPLFADPKKLETARIFLIEMDQKILDVPSAPGWGILLIWFGTPILTLAASIRLLEGWAGWLVGVAAASLVFAMLTVVAGGLRAKIRQNQCARVVQPELTAFLKAMQVGMDELALLAEWDESLQKSSIAAYLLQIRPWHK